MSPFPTYQVIFYIFSAILVLSSGMVVISKKPVRAVLFLILAFISCACLWLMLQAEFLGLILIFVYVGAVMTLFLFVVMMLNIEQIESEGFVKFIPFAVLVIILFVAMIIFVLYKSHLGDGVTLHIVSAKYSNIKALGILLFTHHIYGLEVTGAILLTAMVSAIVLAFHGRKPGVKVQNIYNQHSVTKADRLRLVDDEGELS